MADLVTFWFGSFLYRNGKVAESRPFPKDAKAIASRLRAAKDGSILEEERELAQLESKGLRVFEERLAKLGSMAPLEKAPRDRAASDHGYARELLHAATLVLAREETASAMARPDLVIAQEVRALDELIKGANLLSERLREWFALHFPEAVAKSAEGERLAELVAHHANRATMAEALALPAESLGAEFTEEQRLSLREFATALHQLYATKVSIEARLGGEVRGFAPSLSGLLGPVLAARFIAWAGGLERLAALPSSTIQTLGAENALFRHLREGTKPPKHGLAFQHIRVNTAPWWLRGKIARTLAAMTATAAKADAYTHRDMGAELAAKFEARCEKLRAEHPSPKPRPRPTRAPQRGPPPREARRAARGPPRGPPRKPGRRP